VTKIIPFRKARRLTPEIVGELLRIHSSCVHDQAGKCPLLVSVSSLTWELNQAANIGNEEDNAFKRHDPMCAAHGIFWNKTINKFCVLADVPDDFKEYSKEQYIFSVGGSAAETVIYNDCDEGGARIDRLPFEYEGAPPVAATADEAFDIVSDNKRKLRRLVSLVKAECKRVNLNLALLNETITHKTGDKSEHFYRKKDWNTPLIPSSKLNMKACFAFHSLAFACIGYWLGAGSR
jgi:hypothetical protein